MPRSAPLACLLAIALTGGSAYGDADPIAPDAGPCGQPTREKALQLKSIGERMTKVYAGSLAPHQNLAAAKGAPAGVREVIVALKCAEGTLAAKELADVQAFEARGATWADEEDKRLAVEEAARANIVLPLCQAAWGLENARAAMAHERSNPSGVVDLRVLHDAGEDVLRYSAEIKERKPAYVAFRKHAFTGWQSEGVCVATAAAP